MAKSHREETFGKVAPGTILWCLHCERTYEHGNWREENGMQMCPYKDCDGDAVIDAWEWETICQYHPEYPKKPVNGKIYPR